MQEFSKEQGNWTCASEEEPTLESLKEFQEAFQVFDFEGLRFSCSNELKIWSKLIEGLEPQFKENPIEVLKIEVWI